MKIYVVAPARRIAALYVRFHHLALGSAQVVPDEHYARTLAGVDSENAVIVILTGDQKGVYEYAEEAYQTRRSAIVQAEHDPRLEVRYRRYHEAP